MNFKTTTHRAIALTAPSQHTTRHTSGYSIERRSSLEQTTRKASRLAFVTVLVMTISMFIIKSPLVHTPSIHVKTSYDNIIKEIDDQLNQTKEHFNKLGDLSKITEQFLDVSELSESILTIEPMIEPDNKIIKNFINLFNLTDITPFMSLLDLKNNETFHSFVELFGFTKEERN